jgi:hypothetical protein
MSFLRHGEIYHFDEGAILEDRAPAHRNDEFPAGYSLAGCTPAEPAAASPAEAQLAGKAVRSTIEFQRTAGSVLTVCLTQGDNRRCLRRRLPRCSSGSVGAKMLSASSPMCESRLGDFASRPEGCSNQQRLIWSAHIHSLRPRSIVPQLERFVSRYDVISPILHSYPPRQAAHCLSCLPIRVNLVPEPPRRHA